jgi:hypothetical protein
VQLRGIRRHIGNAMVGRGSPSLCEALPGPARSTLVGSSRMSRLHPRQGHRVLDERDHGDVVRRRSGCDRARKPMREAAAACVIPGPLPDHVREDCQ